MKQRIIYIDNQNTLDKAIVDLKQKKQIFIDLEFDKNHFGYGFKLCLMQLYNGNGTCYLVDPFSSVHIPSIFPILEDDGIQLVCFSFGEDMRLLHKIGAEPKNIFDISIGLNLLNFGTLSMDNAISIILENSEKIQRKNKQQISNWLQRPLSMSQKEYAANDVFFLPELANKTIQKIKSLNREEWLKQEMAAFENKNWTENSNSDFLTVKEKKEFTLLEGLRFEALMKYREKLAQKLDLPTYKVIDRKVSFELAFNPAKIKEWKQLKGIYHRIKTDAIQQEIKHLLAKVEKQIKEDKINANTPLIQPLENEEYQKIKRLNQRVKEFKNDVFLPIKNNIRQQYGENLANFLLSNKKIEQLIKNEIHLLPYQRVLVSEEAKKIGLNFNFLEKNTL